MLKFFCKLIYKEDVVAGHSKWANIQHRKGAQDKKELNFLLN